MPDIKDILTLKLIEAVEIPAIGHNILEFFCLSALHRVLVRSL